MLLSVIVLCFGGTGISHALIIDFEGYSGSASEVGDYRDVGDYRFTLSADISYGFFSITSQDNLIETNETKLFSANHAEVTISRIDGSAFDLLGFDLGGSWTMSSFFNRWASAVMVSSASGSVTTNLPASTGPNYIPVALGSDFLSITSATFIPFVNADNGINNYEFDLDNLEVGDPVPEPATMLLLGTGLVGLAGFRRKSKMS